MSPELMSVLDAVGAAFILLGCWFTFIAALGLKRFPDLLARMHAATKPQTLGLTLLGVGLGLTLRSTSVLVAMLLVVIFQMITAPIAAQMVARAGYRVGAVTQDELAADELHEDMRAAEVALALEEYERDDASRD